MTDNNDDDMMRVYLDDDGVPDGVVDLKELVLTGQRLAGEVALHGNDEAHVRAALDTVGVYGTAAVAVLQIIIEELAVAVYASIETFESVGYPMKDQLERAAAGKPVGSIAGWWTTVRPSRAERRKKRRR